MKALCFDTETTGLIENSAIDDSKQPQMIEFCGQIIGDDGAIIEEEDFLVNPGKLLPEDIKRITGLTDELLAPAKPFAEHAKRLKLFIESANAIVAHNLSYDFAIIDMEMRRLNIQVNWPMIRICTVQETEHFKGHRLTLTSLHEHLFKEGFPNAHRARNDVLALVKCFNELRKRGDL